MAKRSKGHREGEEWLTQATGELRWLQNWEQWTRYLGGGRRRGRKSEPQGDRLTGVISLIISFVLLLILIVALVLVARDGEDSEVLFLIIVGFSMIFIFLKAGIQHIRYSK